MINEVAFVPQIECKVDVGKDDFTYVEGNDCTVAVSFRNQKFIYIIQFSKNSVQRIDLMDEVVQLVQTQYQPSISVRKELSAQIYDTISSQGPNLPRQFITVLTRSCVYVVTIRQQYKNEKQFTVTSTYLPTHNPAAKAYGHQANDGTLYVAMDQKLYKLDLLVYKSSNDTYLNEQRELCGRVLSKSNGRMQETDFVKKTFNAKGWNSYVEKINVINDYDLREPFGHLQATKIIGMTMQ